MINRKKEIKFYNILYLVIILVAGWHLMHPEDAQAMTGLECTASGGESAQKGSCPPRPLLGKITGHGGVHVLDCCGDEAAMARLECDKLGGEILTCGSDLLIKKIYGYSCCKRANPDPPPSKYDYTPLEPLFTGEDDKKGDLVTYIQSIFKFFIWTVGIAALLMLMIGGFMYMTSAGNQANAGTAKKIITDALLGLIVVLFAWVILNVINPDLVKINLSSVGALKVDLKNPSPGGGNGGSLNTNFNPPIPLQPPRAPGPLPSGSLDETSARLLAEELGIDINRAQGCSASVQTACTSLAGLPEDVLFRLADLEDATGGNVVLTGGTESSLHSNGTLHGPGNPVFDLGMKDANVNAFFGNDNNRQFLKNTDQGPLYKITKGSLAGSTVIYEKDHYHVNMCSPMGVNCQRYYR